MALAVSCIHGCTGGSFAVRGFPPAGGFFGSFPNPAMAQHSTSIFQKIEWASTPRHPNRPRMIPGPVLDATVIALLVVGFVANLMV